MYIGDACYVKHDAENDKRLQGEIAQILIVKPGIYEVYQYLDLKTIKYKDRFSIEYLEATTKYFGEFKKYTDTLSKLPKDSMEFAETTKELLKLIEPKTPKTIEKTISIPFWTGVCLKGDNFPHYFNNDFDNYDEVNRLPVDAGIMFFADWHDFLKDFNSHDNETIKDYRNREGWYDKNVCGEDEKFDRNEKMSGKKFPYGFLSNTYYGDGEYRLISDDNDKHLFAAVEFQYVDEPGEY
jgi:hypothetical protein